MTAKSTLMSGRYEFSLCLCQAQSYGIYIRFLYLIDAIDKNLV